MRSVLHRATPWLGAVVVCAAACTDTTSPPARRTFTPARSSAMVPNPGTWTELPPLNDPRFGLGGAAAGGYAYAVGGVHPPCSQVNTTERFDTVARVWTTLAPLPTARSGLAVAEMGGKIYAVGGQPTSCVTGAYSAELDAYDPATGLWTVLPSMPTPGAYFAAASYNGVLYVFGSGNGQAWTTRVDAWDGTSWTTRAPMPFADDEFGAATIGSRIYLAGGNDPRVRIYDPATNSWTVGAAMPQQTTTPSVAAVNGKLYAIGGDAAAASTAVQVYDPATDSWSTDTKMPIGRTSSGVAAINGSIYVYGGAAAGTSNPIGTTEQLTPASVSQPPQFRGLSTSNFSEGPNVLVAIISDPSGVPLTVTLDFGDGSTPAVQSCTPSGGPNCSPSFMHTYDAGTYQATITMNDGQAPTTATFPVDVSNVSPNVTPFLGGTIFVGNTYTTNVTFGDPGIHEFYTASVDYGDGSAALLMPGVTIAGFPLSHTYTSPCTCTVTVMVTDNHGGVGRASAQVTVQNSFLAVQSLSNTVTALGTAGVLSPPAVTALQVPLQLAMRRLHPLTSFSIAPWSGLRLGNRQMGASGVRPLADDDPAADPRGAAMSAIEHLRHFVFEVQLLIRSGELSASNGQPLIDDANRIIAHIAAVVGPPPPDGN